MNQRLTSFFGQLFYYNKSSHFVTHGLPSIFSVPGYNNKFMYRQTFALGQMRPSSLQFTLVQQPQKGMRLQSVIELDDKFRELYRFETSPFGAHEVYELYELKDGFCEERVAITNHYVQEYLKHLKSQHETVLYCSCCNL